MINQRGFIYKKRDERGKSILPGRDFFLFKDFPDCIKRNGI